MSATDDEQTLGERMDQRERMVLYMLFHDPFPWTAEELERELGSQEGVDDAISSLAAAGLVRRLGEFVIPTRAARRCDELYDGVV
jgi:hypothetical protein